MDLLGPGDLNSPVSQTPVVNIPVISTPVSNNNDLLDLLGGLDLSASTPAPVIPQQQITPQMFSPTNSTGYLVDGLLNSSMPIQNCKNLQFFKIFKKQNCLFYIIFFFHLTLTIWIFR